MPSTTATISDRRASRELPLGLVVIGRNEGDRLIKCLDSLGAMSNCVYVDSGSADGSVAEALRRGMAVVDLEIPPAFTAARARNAGLATLLAARPELEFAQTVDGDCEIRPGWIDAGVAALRAEADLAAVFGRIRERHPERSIYNALCDDEWNTPVGISAGCGGIALYRVSALREVRFFNPRMIAGEDTELSMRLRKAGWRIRRLDVEMASHDANITRFRQWWARTRRSGHAYAEMAALHPDAREPNWPRTVRSILFWGLAAPMVAATGILFGVFSDQWWGLLGPLVIGGCLSNLIKVTLHQRRRKCLPWGIAWASGSFLMLGKLPQALGLITYYYNRLTGRASRLIEYKGAETT